MSLAASCEVPCTHYNPIMVSANPSAMSQPETARIEEIFQRLRAHNPEPKGELVYLNPFTLLVAVVLSAQATDVGVNKATPTLFAIADTPDKMVALGEEALSGHIRTIGLYRTKAKNVVALSKLLIERYDGQVPKTAKGWKACRASDARRPMSS